MFYFKPSEFYESKEAKKANISNIPDDFTVWQNIYKVAEHLDIIRSTCHSPIKITSGYRSKELNTLLRRLNYCASLSSLHLSGLAADIVCPRLDYFRFVLIVLEHCNFKYNKGIYHYEDDYYEVILYPTKNFIHFGVKK